MKSLPPDLADRLSQEVTTLATCWKVTRRDGVAQGFTDHDRPLVIDGIAFYAATGFTPTAIASSSDLGIDNLDIEGMLDADGIAEDDLLAGRYDDAKIDVFLVDYTSPESGRLSLKHGRLGQITCTDGRFVAEMRGLTQRLGQRIGETCSPACRAELGDARCKIDMTGRSAAGTLTGVTSRRIFSDSARHDPASRFSFGTIAFTGGANAGIRLEIKAFAAGRFTLVLPLPCDPAVGDTYVATEGCDKTFGTCASRFANAVNFRGEPHVPGIDRMLETATTRSHF